MEQDYKHNQKIIEEQTRLGLDNFYACPYCKTPIVQSRSGQQAENITSKTALQCSSCDARFDIVHGLPFFGDYDSDDMISLIEIAATYTHRDSGVSLEYFAQIERLCETYNSAEDKASFVNQSESADVKSSWFPFRASEAKMFAHLMTGIDLADKCVLDVGAGSGYDSCRLLLRGAAVTALEYSASKASSGLKCLPQVNWVGGFGHSLPFIDESFDTVVCNAALHHMRSVESTLFEMLRVLKPGGYLLTSSDPFKADHQSPDYDFDVFNSHVDVLRGVNESVPRFSDILQPILRYKEFLDISVFTSIVWGVQDAEDGKLIDIEDVMEWPLSELERLSKASGSLHLRIRKNASFSTPRTSLGSSVISASEFARVEADLARATALLTKHLPSSFLDRPFPGTRQTRFEMLNGWQKPEPPFEDRTAYRRARWYFSEKIIGATLEFRIRPFNASEDDRKTFRIFTQSKEQPFYLNSIADSVNAAVNSHVFTNNEWISVTCQLNRLDDSQNFVVELSLEPESEDMSLEAGRFGVRDRNLIVVSG